LIFFLTVQLSTDVKAGGREEANRPPNLIKENSALHPFLFSCRINTVKGHLAISTVANTDKQSARLIPNFDERFTSGPCTTKHNLKSLTKADGIDWHILTGSWYMGRATA